MEKQPHQEYRDKLAEDLNTIRDAGLSSKEPKSKINREAANEYLKVEEKTEEYIGALRLHKEDVAKIIQSKSVDEKIKNILLLKADDLISSGLLEKGASLYREAGFDPKEKLLEIIDIEKDPVLAMRAYEIAGIEMPEDICLRAVEVRAKKIIDKIINHKGTDAFLKPTYETKEEIDWVVNEYKRLGHEDKIIEFAEALLSDKIYDKETGLVLLAEIGETKRIIILAEMYASVGDWDEMLKAYELAGVEIPKEKIIECADKYLERHEIQHKNDHGFYAYIEMILDKYEKAVPEANDRLIKIGNRLIQEGRFYEAEDAYNRAGEEIPKEKIIECADKLRSQGLHGHGDFAINCLELYKLSGDREKLLDAAEQFLLREIMKVLLIYLKMLKLKFQKKPL